VKPATFANYDDKFFDDIRAEVFVSADRILRLTYDLLSPTSIADVGCGDGTWLKAAYNLGVRDLTGFDHAASALAGEFPEGSAVRDVDLETGFTPGRTFDLTLCMEVAEHLAPEVAELLVSDLTSASKAVLFSAAIPFQSGVNHINERPQSYWVSLFQQCGFRCLDVIRPAIWTDNNIAWWYRQNCVLFVPKDRTINADSMVNGAILDLVHPDNHREKIEGLFDKRYVVPPRDGKLQPAQNQTVTAEMLAAGLHIMSPSTNIIWTSDVAILRDVYLAMLAAAPNAEG